MNTAERLQAMRQRLGLSQLGAAQYLGVNVHTYNKWEQGLRNPNSATVRLLDVLELIEREAPTFHTRFLP